MHKTCNFCGEWKPVSDYHVNNHLFDKHHNTCKRCRALYFYTPISLLLEAKLKTGETYSPPDIPNPSYAERIALEVAYGKQPIDDAIFIFSNTIAGRFVKVRFLTLLNKWKTRSLQN